MKNIIKNPFERQKVTLFLLCVVSALFFMASSCGKQNSVSDENSEVSITRNGEEEEEGGNDADKGDYPLKGTQWKLVGRFDAYKDQLITLGPKNCEECYTLWFDTNTTATAICVGMRLKLDLQNLNNPDPELFNAMLWCERYDKDGEDYCDAGAFRKLFITTGSYSATSSELKLFQHAGCEIEGEIISSLIFKRIDDEPPTTLRGTKWKLAGLVETPTGDLKELEPKECEKCYMLEFWGDSICSAHSIWARQNLDLSNLNWVIDPTKPWSWGGPPLFAEQWCEDSFNPEWNGECITYEDSYLFRCGIAYTESYELISNELKLFFVYQEKNYYLLFKLVYQ